MAKVLPLFSSFSSGAISPRLNARADIDAYKNGCTKLSNMVSTSHGPVTNRVGLKMIAWDEPDITSNIPKAIDGRLFGFSVSKSLGTFVAVTLKQDGTTELAVYAPDGSVTPPSVELVTNPSFETGIGWTDDSQGTGSVSFVNGRCNILPGTKNQSVTYVDTWTNDNNTPNSAGFCDATTTSLDVNNTSNTSADHTTTLQNLVNGDSFRIEEVGDANRFYQYTVTGSPTDQGGYYSIPISLDSQGNNVRNNRNSTVTYNSTSPIINKAGISQQVAGTVNGNNLTLTINGVAGGGLLNVKFGTAAGLSNIFNQTYLAQNIQVEFLNIGGATGWLTIDQDESAISRSLDSVSIYDSTINKPIDTKVRFVGPWTAEDLPTLQADSPPEGDILYISSSFTPPQKLIYTEATNSWTFEPVTFVGQPVEWVAGNYPKAITFYQGRMWLGGTPTEKERFWASKSASLEDFTQGALDDDGLDFTISEQGEIAWVIGARNLIIGTATGEHIVESFGGVITPSDIEIKQQSAYGSRDVQSVKIGQKVMYTSPDGRKVREIGYQWTDDGWISRDITFASEHITKDKPILDMSFAQNPENLLWCVTEDGNVVCSTYEKTYNVIGWHDHFTDGDFKSVASIDINGSSVAGFLVNRVVGGEERMFFEILHPEETYPMDSWKYFYSETPTNTVTGMLHLAGTSVQVLTDKGTHPDILIDANGVGYLQQQYNEFVCGRGYLKEMITLSSEVIGNEGATNAMNKSWNKIFVRVIDSGVPVINDIRGDDRSTLTPMDTPEPFKTEDIEIVDLGWSKMNLIKVNQDLPLPLTVVAVYGEQARENL